MTKSLGIYRKAGRYTRVCSGCGAVIVRHRWCDIRQLKYCSHACYSKSRRGIAPHYKLKGRILVPKVSRQCAWCGDVFKTRWWRPKKYCGHTCYVESRRGSKHSAATKAKISAASKAAGVFKRLHKDPEFQRKRIRGLHAKPNGPEMLVRRLLHRLFPGEYRYTGNGAFLIDGLNPDFVNVNGQKKVIEVFGETFHDPNVSLRPVPHRATEPGRRQAFAKYGYKMLVLWSKEIYRKGTAARHRLERKLVEFHEDRSH